MKGIEFIFCRLSIVLIINDVFFVTRTFRSYTELNAPHFLGYLGHSFYFGVIPPPYSTTVYYISVFCSSMCHNGVAVVSCFCCMCILLQKALVELEKKVCLQTNAYIFELYIEIMNFIQTLNGHFHALIFLSVSVILVTVFHQSYSLFFMDEYSVTNTIFKIFCIIFLSINFTFYAQLRLL